MPEQRPHHPTTVGGRFWRRITRALARRTSTPQLEDRRILEEVIFVHYARLTRIRTVLFVGCASYTSHYQRYFTAHSYWTLDADPERRRFGAQQHVTGRLEQLRQHFSAGFFDLIVCNGVYGWGLDSAEDCNAALSACHTCLAEHGHLVFGWNDTPRWDPAPLAAVHGFARFAQYSVPALGSTFLTGTAYRHTYRFLQKA